MRGARRGSEAQLAGLESLLHAASCIFGPRHAWSVLNSSVQVSRMHFKRSSPQLLPKQDIAAAVRLTVHCAALDEGLPDAGQAVGPRYEGAPEAVKVALRAGRRAGRNAGAYAAVDLEGGLHDDVGEAHLVESHRPSQLAWVRLAGH